MEEIISVGPWGCEEGTPFSHRINNGRIQKLVILYEGGFKSLTINNSTETTKNHQPASVIKPKIQPTNIISNANFSQAVGAFWRSDDCAVEVISGSAGEGCHSENHVIVSKRRHFYTTIAHDITRQICIGGLYEVLADVSVKGGNGQEFEMCATVKIENMDNTSSFLHIGSVFVKDQEWKKLECWFHLNRVPKRAIFYIVTAHPTVSELPAQSSGTAHISAKDKSTEKDQPASTNEDPVDSSISNHEATAHHRHMESQPLKASI